MLTRRIVLTSLICAMAGTGFMAAAAAQPASGGNTNAGTHIVPSYYYTQRYAREPSPLRGDFGRSPEAPPIGYACTWSGSRNLAQGETAYQHGSYNDAIAQWKTAASKDCAVAAYKLGMLYYGGKPQVAVDRSLGAAWLRVAAESKTNNNPYYHQISQQAVAKLTTSQRAQYTADYAKLSAILGSSIAR